MQDYHINIPIHSHFSCSSITITERVCQVYKQNKINGVSNQTSKPHIPQTQSLLPYRRLTPRLSTVFACASRYLQHVNVYLHAFVHPSSLFNANLIL